MVDAVGFGEYLKNLRTERGLTIRQVEAFSGVSNSYLSQLENGKRGIPSPDILKKLAPAYRIKYETLMTAAGYLTDDASPKETHDGQKLFTPEQLKEAGIEYMELVEYMKAEDLTPKEVMEKLEAIKEFRKKVESKYVK